MRILERIQCSVGLDEFALVILASRPLRFLVSAFVKLNNLLTVKLDELGFDI
jgi:hypothetical protein